MPAKREIEIPSIEYRHGIHYSYQQEERSALCRGDATGQHTEGDNAIMSVFAIILKEANAEVTEQIAEVYPEHYQYTDTFFLVESNKLAETVAASVGIKGKHRAESASGAVFELTPSYSGYTTRSLWDWLRRAEEQA